ncbi:hypothetical protein MF271_21750 (plasmid) [Deinococcus sp. KNUC1210]|uniref:TlpA family protein disulfide reductase n=1 Tax=Deinococcus sp. KNUC1210 TaxID=2917691 RepID=UPI001EEF9649|nr:hypothetical protein [Deinococcus sp. KNUC1210]ULH17826.1 hypothetical protein MF271_21750 [Deinococcus sp. KNUC1210]
MIQNRRPTLPCMLPAALLLALSWLPSTLADGQAASEPHINALVTGPTGERFTLDRLNGRPRILHFFTGRCRTCSADDALLRGWAFEYADQQVVLLNVYASITLKRSSVSRAPLLPDVPEVIDPSARLARFYHLDGTAGTVFLNAQGEVVARLPEGLSAVLIVNMISRSLHAAPAAQTSGSSP